MSVGGDTRPFREKYPGYATVFPGTLASHYKQVLGTVKKNTTQPNQTDATRSHYGEIGYWGMLAGESGTGCPASVNFFTDSNNFLDPNTGKSTTPAALRYVYNCGNCYNGITDPIRLQDNANTFSACDALLAVTVTNGGTGYTDGDVLTITGAYPETINGVAQVATFRLKVTAGVIQSATVLTAGCYSGIGANALTAQTTATGGTGTGATFTFTRKDAQYDFGRCNIVGWAAAAAARQWHGTYGFLDACYTCPTDNTQGNPPQTKYLKITFDDCENLDLTGFDVTTVPLSLPSDDTGNGGTENGGIVFVNSSQSFSGSNSVNENSGVISYGVETYSLSDRTDIICKNGIQLWYDSPPNVDGTFKLDGSGNTVAGDGSDSPNYPNPFCNTYVNSSSWEVYADGVLIDSGTTTPSLDAADYDNYQKEHPDSNILVSIQISNYTLNNTYFEWSELNCYYMAYAPADDLKPSRWSECDNRISKGTITLSEPNTPTDVIADSNENLLSPWVLVDPVLMPLTTQPFDGTVVKVSRNEVGTNVSPANYVPLWIAGVPLVGGLPQVYVDPNLAALTAGGLTAGQILGLPLDKTIGGDYPLDYFMPDYIRYICEDCSGGGTSSWDEYTIGDWRSNHANLPPRATQWTNTQEALFINTGRKQFIGGWVGTETGDDNICTTNASDKIWSTKWIETSVRLPSVNHARPFGLDRYTLDATKRACVDSFDGTTLTTLGSEPTFTAGDFLACVGTDADGLYTFDSMSGTDYLLTFVSALPDNFPPLPTGDVNGIVAKINWDHVPPMAGRLHIISIADNGDGTVTVTSDPMPVLNKADTLNPLYNVDLSDKTMTPLAKNLVPAAEIPDSNGNLPGSTSSTPGQKPLGAPVDYIPTPLTTSEFICTADYATVKDAVWLTLYGAIPTADTSPAPPAEVAPWYWNDDKGKGNYWIGQWFYENQVYSDAVAVEYQKGFVYCSPYAIVISPNATDTPTGVNYAGVRYDFSTPFIADEFCASARWMDVCQMMTYPYWKTPLCCPSVSSHPANSYPYVEARLIMPGAHAQPDNGAGMTQTESAPSGGNHINYTVDLSAATGLGSTPPIANTIFSQPACVLAPTGVYIAQPDTYCSP